MKAKHCDPVISKFRRLNLKLELRIVKGAFSAQDVFKVRFYVTSEIWKI